jgi:hypothetical protein
MKRRGRASRIAMVLTLAGITGCSRQLAAPASGSTPDSRQLPFDRVSDNGGFSPTAEFASDGIPVGTKMTIRLQQGCSSSDSRAGDSFRAVLDKPIVQDGKTVISSGTPVTGRVIAVKASAGEHDPGYLRVTLVSLTINGKSLAVETSSIFAKGQSYARGKIPMIKGSGTVSNGVLAAADPANGNQPSLGPGQADARFSTGRRLTFRLAQPLHLPG